MGFAIPANRDWEREPSVLISFQPIWDRDHFVDRFAAYITGRRVDGRRYCRAVEVTGSMIENGDAQKRLQRVLTLVIRDGPSLCSAIEDGGTYPREADQPLIE